MSRDDERPRFRCPANAKRLMRDAEARLARKSQAEQLAKLKKENAALLKGMLTPEVFIRITQWLNTHPIKPANQAFTAGTERQLAYCLERSVVPLVQQLTTYRREFDITLRHIIGMAGHPDAAQGCRNVIARAKEALGEK